jgi:hypothetical protein
MISDVAEARKFLPCCWFCFVLASADILVTDFSIRAATKRWSCSNLRPRYPHVREQDDVWDLQTRNSSQFDGWLQIDMRDASRPRLAFQIIRRDLTVEQQNLALLCRNIRMQDRLGITAVQEKRLDSLAGADCEPPKKMMDAMLRTFLQWQKLPPGNDRDALEAALFTQLSDATRALNLPTKAEVVNECAKILEILTPDQQKKMETQPPS